MEICHVPYVILLILLYSSSSQIAPNRKEIGVAFKKEAKAVTDYLEAMSECDALELKAKLESGSGTITVDKQVCRAIAWFMESEDDLVWKAT